MIADAPDPEEPGPEAEVPATAETKAPPDAPPDEAILIWQSLTARRIAYDQMVWQTPALGLSAQAFLLTLALGGQTTSLGRAVAAGLSATLALMTLQLMGKHHFHELRDLDMIKEVEARFSFTEFMGFGPHAFAPRPVVTGKSPKQLLKRFRASRSVRLWMLGQLSFLLVSLLVLALVVTRRDSWLIFR